MKISKARKAAYKNLLRIERDGGFSTELLARTEVGLDPRDRNLIHSLTLGVQRKKLLLDSYISNYTKKSLSKFDLEVLTILRLSAFQLIFMDRLPAYSVINEAVELTRFVKKRSASGMVNAILRKLADKTPETLQNQTIKQAALNTSHPVELLKQWESCFGSERAIAIAEANNREPRSAFRFTAAFDRLPKTEQASIRLAIEAKASVNRSCILTDSFVSERIDPELRSFADEGVIYFQDEASQLAAKILSGFGGQMVLNVCAAPGSKATSIARDGADSAQIFAADLHFRRAKLLKISALKQKAALNILCLNAEFSLPFPEDVFDTIIVDAPCSGTGTIRRNPEIRYRVDESNFEELQKKQLSILSNASNTLKSGGVLLYSTCSLEPQENEMVVEKFLENHTDFEIIKIDETGVTHTERGFIRTFPDTHQTDGFFIACMRRR